MGHPNYRFFVLGRVTWATRPFPLRGNVIFGPNDNDIANAYCEKNQEAYDP